MSRPLLLLALCLALGSRVGGDVGARGAAVLLGLAALTLGLVVRGPTTRIKLAGLAAVGVGIGAAGAGIEVEAYEHEPLGRWLAEQPPAAEPWRLEGVALGDARDSVDRFVLILDLDRAEPPGGAPLLRGRVRVDVGGEGPRPEIIDGDRVGLFATLVLPRGFGNPGAYDAVAAARHEGIVATGYCKSTKLLTPLGRGDVGLLRELTGRARRAARHVLRRFIVPGPEEGLVRAMVLGDRTGVDAATAEAFRNAGTYHVLALSGAQVALLVGLAIGGLRRLQAPPALVAILATLGIGFYAAFVGADVPVVRAALMAAVMLGGRALDLDADLANLLGLAAGILLLQRPSNVQDVGFELSFGATLGLLLFSGKILEGQGRWPLRLDAAVAGSLAAQVPLVPLLAAEFHRLTPAAVLLNLLAVPLSGAVLLCGFAVLPVAGFPVVASCLGDVAWIAAHALLRSNDPASWLPAIALRVPSPSLVACLIYAAGLASLLRGAGKRWAFALILFALGLLVAPVGAVGDGRLRLTVLDVGQGDGLVLRSPHGRVRLVDAGGSYDGRFDTGESVVAPYLWSQGVACLDGIVITHAHPDHVGGVPALLRAFPVGEVWEGLAPRRDPFYRVVDEALFVARVRRRAVVRGVTADWDGVSIRTIWPGSGGAPPARAQNNDSVVLEIAFGRVRLLLSGDVEARSEARLDVSRLEVLKVPHHGSRTSSSLAFVRRVNPRLALVSAGFRNRFGHPDPAVVGRYRRQGTRLLTTAEEGAITVSTDGVGVWVETYRTGREERLQ